MPRLDFRPAILEPIYLFLSRQQVESGDTQESAMDIERFLSLRNDQTKTKDDLFQMRANTLSKNAIEHVHLAEQVEALVDVAEATVRRSIRLP